MTIEKNDDYIKRSWVLQEIEHDLGCHDISRSTDKSLFVNLGDMVRMLLAAPKENVMPVVRCGECKHWHRETGYCELDDVGRKRLLLRCRKGGTGCFIMNS